MEEDIFLKEEIRNDKLLGLMKKMRTEKSQESMLEVLKESAASRFVVPVTVNDGHYSFTAVSDSKGKKYVVAFSDSGSFEVTKLNDDIRAVDSSFDDLMDLVVGQGLDLDGIIINPGAEEILLGKEMLTMIKQQISGGDVSCKAGVPDHYPEGMLQKTKDFCEEYQIVEELYIRLYLDGEGNARGWLFVIKSAARGEERDYIYNTFERYIEPYADGLMVVTADKGEDWVKSAVGDSEPFYRKRS